MNPKASTLLFVAFSLFISSTTAFNITKLLGQYSDFSNFNDYLTQTKLYEEINRRQTITVLAVDNGALPAGKSVDVMKKVMSVHVVLDYYDISKLQKLSNKTALLTTLYQSSGSAKTQQGFLNVTILANGDVVFGSAVEGSALNSKLMKSVAAQPYNISVLQISIPIVTPGLGYDGNSSSSPPAKSPEKSEAPAPSKKSDVEAPAPAPAKKDAKAPEAATPKSSSADAPASSVDSPPPAVAEAPLTDTKVPPVADAVAPPPNSSGTRVGVFGAGLLVMGLVVAF